MLYIICIYIYIYINACIYIYIYNFYIHIHTSFRLVPVDFPMNQPSCDASHSFASWRPGIGANRDSYTIFAAAVQF